MTRPAIMGEVAAVGGSGGGGGGELDAAISAADAFNISWKQAVEEITGALNAAIGSAKQEIHGTTETAKASLNFSKNNALDMIRKESAFALSEIRAAHRGEDPFTELNRRGYGFQADDGTGG